MVFGKIEYLNLLPFHVFMKRFMQHSSAKMAMRYHKGVPTQINKKFITRKVDAAFISSISARGFTHLNLGIVAEQKVKSVIVIPHNDSYDDVESASSNMLAKVLGQRGQVLIGDKALLYALSHNDYKDLATLWYDKYKLPFVFALLCFHNHKVLFQKIEKKFLAQKIKIPQYILHKASSETNINALEITSYLECIRYKVDRKAKKGLKQFYSLI